MKHDAYLSIFNSCFTEKPREMSLTIQTIKRRTQSKDPVLVARGLGVKRGKEQTLFLLLALYEHWITYGVLNGSVPWAGRIHDLTLD